MNMIVAPGCVLFATFFMHEANALMRVGLDKDLATEIVQDDVISQCPECARNYAVECPLVILYYYLDNTPCVWRCPHILYLIAWQGWQQNQLGDACEASDGYEGPCSRQMFMGYMSAKDKSQIETRLLEECRARFVGLLL